MCAGEGRGGRAGAVPLRWRKVAANGLRCPRHGTLALEKGHDRRGAVLAAGKRAVELAATGEEEREASGFLF